MAARTAAYIFRRGQNEDGSGPRQNPSKDLVREWGTEREAVDAQLSNAIYGTTGPVFGAFYRLDALEAYDRGVATSLNSLSTRIGVIEGAAGFDPTTLNNIKTDADASRITQYVGRPGDAIQSWTRDVTVKPSTATRLATIDGVISLNTLAKGGSAVLVKGRREIGPIPWVWIEKGRVYPSRSIIARTLNDANGDNAILARIAYFQPDGTYVNFVECKTTTIAVADGPTTVEFSISTEPGRADYNFPLVDGGYARLFFVNRGQNGEMAVAESNFGNIVSFAALIRGSLTYTHIPDTALIPFYDSLTGIAGQISFANIVADIGAKLMPQTFPSYPEDIVADQKSKVVLLPDDGRRNILLQSEKVDLAINFNGKRASFDQASRSIIQFAGQSIEHGDVGNGAISIAARTPDGVTVAPSFPSPVYCRIDRLSVGYPQGQTYGDDVMAYWIDEVDPRFRTGMRTFLNKQLTRGIMGPDGSGKMQWMTWAGASVKNNAFNLANPGGKQLILVPGSTGIVTVPYGYLQSLSTDAYGKTGMLPGELGWDLSSHFMMVKPFDTAIDAAGIAMGDSSNLYITANLTATQAATRSGAGRETPQPVNPGSSIIMNRRLLESYDVYQNGVFVSNYVRALGTLPSGPLNLMATYASQGYAAVSILKWRYFLAGFPLNAQGTIQEFQLHLDELQAVNDQIRMAA